MKRVGQLLAGCALLAMGALASWAFCAKALPETYYSPDSWVIRLPEFKGRIFTPDKIHPGTFSVRQSFDNVSEWGQDALMTFDVVKDYEGRRTDMVTIMAWRPDPQTAGVYQYAQKTVQAPDRWRFHSVGIDMVQQDGSLLRVTPRKDKFLGSLIVGLVAVLALVAVGAGIWLMCTGVSCVRSPQKA